ncbi:type VI secretion system-associated protein TagO [Rheinheimera sp.]|uniref:type VI secretion system-associated protein TagO n=1 Tax=Rheinheimera sp. TaxID=1869214 RepID=UPI003AF5A473
MRAAVIFVLLGVPFTSQADPLETELSACRVITQSQTRLQCYDAIKTAPTQAQAAPTPQASKAVSVVSAQTKSNTSEQEFGFEHKTTQLNKAQELSLVLQAVSTNPYGIKTFSFTNGQVWRQTSKETFNTKLGNRYVLERGAFNSFSLKEEGQNRKTGVRREK